MSSEDVEIRLFFKGGCTIPGLFGSDIVTPLLDFQPDAAIFCIGDNDLKQSSSGGGKYHEHLPARRFFKL